MKSKVVLIISMVALCCIVLSGCSSAKESSDNTIPYKIAEHYFIRNDVVGLPPTVITSWEEFEKYFGMAAVMGKNGQPTEIDFNKDFVISISLAPTDIDTRLSIVSLTKAASSHIVMKYTIERGEKMSYAMQPLVLLIVDKKYEMPVKPEPI